MIDALKQVVGSTTARTVFGEPITRGEVTIIPVAKMKGGGGGGGGTSPGPDSQKAGGSGGGLSLSAKPLGVFVVKGRKVRWQPAVDINKAILGGQLVAVVALLTVRALVKARRS